MTPDSIEATLNHIRFQNDDGFLIGRFQVHGNDRKEIIGLGNILQPEIGMKYRLFGRIINDPKWGKQYKFQTYEAIVPKSTSGIYRYLVRVAKFVGPKIGMAITEQYGEDTLDVLKADPERVATEIRGITIERAKNIQAALIKNEQTEAAIVEVERIVGGLGLRKNLATELVAKHGYDAIKLLKDNPYNTLTKIRGIGFLAADKVALQRLKYQRGDNRRRMAGVKYILEQNRLNGNIWMRESKLIQDVSLGVSIGKDILDACVDKRIIVRNGELVALFEDSQAETYISVKILELMGEPQQSREDEQC